MFLASPGVLLQADRRWGGYSSTFRLERLPLRQCFRGADVHDLRFQQEGRALFCCVRRMYVLNGLEEYAPST